MKNIFTTILFIIITSVQAQVIIGNATGTAAVKTSVLLEFAKENKGLIVPYVRAKPATPAEGTILLDATNSSTARMKFFNGAWQDLSGHDADISTALSIQPTIVEVPEASTAKTIIGAQTSSADGALVLESTSKAMVLPTVKDVQDIPSPSPGMMVYVNKAGGKRLAVYNGNKWSFWKVGNPSTTGTGLVNSYNCNKASAGTMNAGTPVAGVTQTITANVTTLGSYNIKATANGVTFSGLGVFTSTGAQDIILNATGTPTAAGTSNFVLNTTPGCSFDRVILVPSIVPDNIVLSKISDTFIASVFDQDYQPYTVPTGPATFTTPNAADGISDAATLDLQGIISTVGIPIIIPCVATSTGTLLPFSQKITIPASYTQDGNSREIILSWPSTPFNTATKKINATIVSVDATLNIKKLDLQNGIGADALGVLLGSFSYPYNNTGATYSHDVRAIAGIPDRMFGTADNTGSNTSHNFIYLPITTSSGKTWLNMNLGADYAKINTSDFHHTKIVTSINEYKAFGSLFQWGRKPDGHDVVNWTSGTTAVFTPTTTTRSDNPTNNEFIALQGTSADWRINGSTTLWLGKTAPNNPCPNRYRVPTAIELDEERVSLGITNTATALSSTLNIPVPGYREQSDGRLLQPGVATALWSSTDYGSLQKDIGIDLTILEASAYLYGNNKRFGLSVRCIKD